jgi:hypothetical protein
MSLLSTIIDTLKNLNISNPEMVQIENWEEGLRFLGIKIINVGDFTELLVRFLFNTLVLFVIVHYMYAKKSNRKEFYFSYMAIGAIVFLLCFLLSSVKLELAFALGLFAIFGIIRYRTDTIPIKEMTYLFVVIGISVMNALSNKKVSYAELVFTNAAIAFGLWLLEKMLILRQEKSIKLIYEKIADIQGKSDEMLLAQLKQRTGINISRFKIVKIDFLKNVAELTLYYHPNGNSKISNK